jgi:hypothetical protein
MTNQPSPVQEVPEEIKQFIGQLIADTESSCGQFNAGIRTGTEAMYTMMQEKVLWYIDDHAKGHSVMVDILNLRENRLQDAAAKIQALESELAAARALIDEKNAWIESHA